jgi:Ca2+-transporting ATPase
MWKSILWTGGIFFVALLGFLYYLEHWQVTSLLHVGIPGGDGLTPYELSIFFTVFVFLQFWNMFNARAFNTGRSAFHLRDCGEFGLIIAMIFFGQILIVQIGGNFFNVVPLRISDWLAIIAATSLVLWLGELLRLKKH